MEKQIYVKPRQTGKTNQAVHVFKSMLRDEGAVGVFLCYNSGMVNNVKRILGNDYNFDKMKICTYSSVRPELFAGHNFNVVVMDEFLNIQSRLQKETYKVISKIEDRIKLLFMISTPNMQVQPELFEYIKEYKYIKTFAEILEYCESNFWVDRNIVEYWHYNFMTDADAVVVVDNFFASSTPTEEYKQML